MSLTQNQLLSLRTDLQRLANIEYDDVLAELLDHYASLTEQRMATGLSFEDASKWAWFDLGSGEGLQNIQDDYASNIQQQVKARHLEILRSYFRWPAFVTTVLIGGLVYLTIPMLPFDVITVIFFVLLLTPVGITMWGYRKSVDRQTSSSPIAFKYMQQSGALFINLAQIGLNFSGGLFGYPQRQTFLQTHPNVSVLVGLLALLYLTSFVQLFREQFMYKPKTRLTPMLTADQLAAIDRHLRKENWLLNEDLIVELTDHYAAGLDERLARGQDFDTAIREIHRNFGGRKGLLQMEEDFQKSQAQHNGRIIRSQITSYFRLPKLGITSLLVILVYSLIRLVPTGLAFLGDSNWIFITLLTGLGVLYVLAFVHLVNALRQTSKAKSLNHELRVLVQVITSLASLCLYVKIWIPVEQVLTRYPLIASLIITVFIIIELATIELLVGQLNRKKSLKPA